MPSKLDDELVADALQALRDWSGDSSAIRRTATVPADHVDGLLASVQTAADAANHHPDVSRDGTELTFVLSTHSIGGVSELDIALATRIDDLIRDAGGHVEHQHGQPGAEAHRVSTAAEAADTPAVAEPADAETPPMPEPGLGGGVRPVGGVHVPETAEGSPAPGPAEPEERQPNP